MSDTQLNADGYRFQGLSPAVAAYAATLNLAGGAPSTPPPDPQQQLAAVQQQLTAMQHQLTALYAKDDALAQRERDCRRFNRNASHIITERRNLAAEIDAHRASMQSFSK